MKIFRLAFAILLVILILLVVREGNVNHGKRKQIAEVEESVSLARSRGRTSSAPSVNRFVLERNRSTVLEGIPVTGSPHRIKSPYSPDGPLMDVQGLAAGTKIECPTTRRSFFVPEMADSGTMLLTRRYQVPLWFLSMSIDTNNEGGAALHDPFAEGSDEHAASPPDPVDILKSRGIVFDEEGANVFYRASTSVLVVRNTAVQLEFIDAFVESLNANVPKEVHAGSRFVEIK